MLTTRAAVAALQLAFIQLIEAAGFQEIPLTDLSINFDGRSFRIDVARLDENGHIAEWLAGYSIDPRNLATFGTPAPLPNRGPVQ